MADTIRDNLDTKCGMIAQLYGEGKAKGCEYCNEFHPKHNSVNGVKTHGDQHYIRIEYQSDYSEETGATWDFYDMEVYYCPQCGRNLDLPVDLTAWG